MRALTLSLLRVNPVLRGAGGVGQSHHSSIRGPGRSLQLCLRLLDPVCHLHLAVHRRRGREVLSGLLMLAYTPGELAESKVAVSDEGAHPEWDGECHRLMVVA